jgi:hypothetical protein
LTSSADSDQHKKIDYAEIETDATGKLFRVTWAPGGKKATITGPCPECQGLTSTEFNAGIPDTSGFRGPKKIPTLPSPVTLLCECGRAHDDRPADAPDRGCGRYWLLYVDAAERVHPQYLS